MVSPVNSKLIYRILKHYRQKPDSQLFKLLHLDPSNGGRRFKNGLNGKCWWPKHSDWFYNLVDGSREDDDVFFVDSQEFPLTGSRDELIHIVSLENEKDIQCYGGGQIRFLLDDCPRQMTFESCVYDVLMETFRIYAYNDFPEICKTVSGLCEQEGVEPAAVEELSAQPDVESFCRRLVQMGKDAGSTPLLRKKEAKATQKEVVGVASIQLLEQRMEMLLQKMEMVESIVTNTLMLQNELLDRVSPRMPGQDNVREQLMEDMEQLQRKSKDYYEECLELKDDVHRFAQNQRNSESQSYSPGDTQGPFRKNWTIMDSTGSFNHIPPRGTSSAAKETRIVRKGDTYAVEAEQNAAGELVEKKNRLIANINELSQKADELLRLSDEFAIGPGESYEVWYERMERMLRDRPHLNGLPLIPPGGHDL